MVILYLAGSRISNGSINSREGLKRRILNSDVLGLMLWRAVRLVFPTLDAIMSSF